ncbi:MAG: tRNA (N6-threonylcarbamoyladenosine(37)-N6)-methyltransferase TrmO [Gammaproteobacteria bacterium]|nr:tRNA (N6-threonylcarbamoyladenosine(37)-N6)-methyltransferase TrmO [Gammaproteobacteria bacterium]
MTQYNFSSIGIVYSCYKEKFGIPRQPALVASPATIEIEQEYSNDEAFRELENFSHIWVIFVFHGISKNNGMANENWKSTVRPPRLGGNKRIGVFASRSMFRPNPIGLSVVELKSIERKGNKIILNIIGGDFLDATPVIDIKPYIPYVDSVDTAKAGYAIEKPKIKLQVDFSDAANVEVENAENIYPKLKKTIEEILRLDPRPAYQREKKIKNEFAIKLYEYDVKWKVENERVIVTSLTLLE